MRDGGTDPQPPGQGQAQAGPVKRHRAAQQGDRQGGEQAEQRGYALKLLLAGADVVHLASALLEHGPGRLSQILNDMKTWMIEREYESVAQLKGSMCQANLRDASALARQSYIRVLDSFTPRPGVWR